MGNFFLVGNLIPANFPWGIPAPIPAENFVEMGTEIEGQGQGWKCFLVHIPPRGHLYAMLHCDFKCFVMELTKTKKTENIK